jgi:hypothetical protein
VRLAVLFNVLEEIGFSDKGVEIQGLKGRARQKITAGLARLSDRFVSCRRLGEPVLQRFDPCQVVAHVVVTAPLAGG